MIRPLSFTALFFVAGLGCKDKRTDAVGPEPSQSGGAVVEAAPSAVAPEAPKQPPTLVMQRLLERDVPGDAGIYVLSGKLVVVSNNRVGRVDGDKVEWTHKTNDPNDAYAFGRLLITSIGGEYPDALDGFMQHENGRAPAPSFVPLSGKGYATTFAPGGGWGDIHGTAKVGESEVIHGSDMMEGDRVVTIRGPRVERFTTPAVTQNGCAVNDPVFPAAAVRASAFGGAKNGMLVSAGHHCSGERLAALEVWPPGEKKPKIIKLDKGVNDFFRTVHPSGDDGVYIVPFSEGRIVELHGDTVTLLPQTPPLGRSFLDDEGVLHVTTDDAILRLEGGAWVTVAKIPWGTVFSTIVRHGDAFYVGGSNGVARLVEGKSLEYAPDCKTPFVFLYDVSWLAEPTYTFPTTRKAFSTFAGLAEIQLVEFDLGRRRLGVIVPDKATADAVIAHVNATMKDEKPRLVCLEPKVTRKIPFSTRP